MARNMLSWPTQQVWFCSQFPNSGGLLLTFFSAGFNRESEKQVCSSFLVLGNQRGLLAKHVHTWSDLQQRAASLAFAPGKCSGNKCWCLYAVQMSLHKSPQRPQWCCLLSEVPSFCTLSEYGPKCFPGLGPNTCTFALEDKVRNDI